MDFDHLAQLEDGEATVRWGLLFSIVTRIQLLMSPVVW
jgi:hypothetical protein